MNPSSGESISAPTPQFEAPQPAQGPEQQHDKKMEESGQSEAGAGKQQPAALNAVLQIPVDIPAAAPVAIPADTTQDDQSASGTDLHQTDSRVMEAQWVERAKKVIAQTKDDPHAQKQKMSQVKAEYIRKRFNKTIPTDDSAAA